MTARLTGTTRRKETTNQKGSHVVSVTSFTGTLVERKSDKRSTKKVALPTTTQTRD